MFQKIDLNSNDFGTVINCAIRYCLGRRTYMPGVVCDYVRPLLPHLNQRTVACMERDIRECQNYGDECDVQTWTDFLKAVREVMFERDIEGWN